MRNKKLIISIAVLFIFLILGIFLFTLFNKKSSNNININNKKIEALKGNVLFMKDWDFYRNDSLGIAIQHPKNMDAIEYLDNGSQKSINFKYKDQQSSSYNLIIIDNKDKKFKNDNYRVIYSNPNDFNISKTKVNIDDVVGTRYIADDNANGKNMADDIIFEKDGKTYIISATIKDANFENFYRTFDFLN